MKVVEKITLVIYSNIILILSIIACLLVFRWLDINVVESLMAALLLGETSSKIILGVSIVFILLSIRCIFFDPTSKQELKDKEGVLLANENGKLMISKETIQNIVDGVTKEYKGTKEVSSKVMLDKNNNVNITAVDINKNAIKYLNENIRLNKLHNIEAICGDINEVSKNLNKKYDRIIMNLPGLAYEFLDLAMTLTANNGIINYYEFSDSYGQGIERLQKAAKKENKKVEILNTRKVKSSSPGMWHVAIDAKVIS